MVSLSWFLFLGLLRRSRREVVEICARNVPFLKVRAAFSNTFIMADGQVRVGQGTSLLTNI